MLIAVSTASSRDLVSDLNLTPWERTTARPGRTRTDAAVSPSAAPHRPTRRPRLAVVIGSGGVRSIAALGLLDVLRRNELRPDLIVGCSAGAIFGALAASGLTAAEGLAMARRLWTREITQRPRRGAVARMVLPHLMGFGPDFALRCDRLVMQRLVEAFGEQRLESLGTPMRVTATDADTGGRVVLTEGLVVEALRASIALPFMFEPRAVNGRRLVDGFLSDPLPVSAALDADCIVALGVEAPLPRRIDRPTRMLSQVTSAMTNNLMHAQVAAAQAGGARVISIMPKPLQRVGLFDTDAMPALVELGRRCAEEVLHEVVLAHLANERHAAA